MDYIVCKRYKQVGIGGYFNLPYGTIVEERDGFLHTSDGRRICAATSEDGWCHFRPNTAEGAYRQAMLDRLYKHYESGKGNAGEDFDESKWPGAVNLYWKNLLRTMATPELEAYYKARLGTPPEMEG